MPTALMFIRHAESENRPLKKKIFKELGDSVYLFAKEYERQRLPNPGLSERGRVQAKELAHEVGQVLMEEDEDERTLLVTSPMLCALETSLVLARHGQIERHRFLCNLELFEIGSGLLHRAQRPTTLAAELEAEFGVNCSPVPGDDDYPERDEPERDDEAAARVARTWAWLEGLLESDEYSFIVVVAGDHLLSRWLQHLGGAEGRLAFAHGNTGRTFIVWHNKRGAEIVRLNNLDHLMDGRAVSDCQGWKFLAPLGS